MVNLISDRAFADTVYSFEFAQAFFALQRSETDSPTLQFCYIILCTEFNYLSFEFALKSEGETGEIKWGRNFPCIQYPVSFYKILPL